jgi:hypothetical protein
MPMAQIYEVTAIVADDRKSEFETYMSDEHVPDVLATECFAAAFFAKDEKNYVFGYHVNTPEDMQRYLDNHAAKLRDDVIQRFDDSVQTSRRMLDIIKLFPSP